MTFQPVTHSMIGFWQSNKTAEQINQDDWLSWEGTWRETAALYCLSSLVDNSSHSLHIVLAGQRSPFSQKPKRCQVCTECQNRFFLPAAVRERKDWDQKLDIHNMCNQWWFCITVPAQQSTFVIFHLQILFLSVDNQIIYIHFGGDVFLYLSSGVKSICNSFPLG